MRVFHLANQSWSIPPGSKPGQHMKPNCGKTKDIDGRDIVVIAQSDIDVDKNSTYILDLEVC